jgi:hypothetical protein
MDTTFIDIPLRESTAQNGHLQQSLDLPKLPDLPSLPEPEITLDQMLSACVQGNDIKKSMAEWIESAAYLNFSEEEELLEVLSNHRASAQPLAVGGTQGAQET